MIARRLGPDPHANGQKSAGCSGCPDVFELLTGDFAIIGIDETELLRPHLPASAGCGPDERIVRVPRDVLIGARPQIPTQI